MSMEQPTLEDLTRFDVRVMDAGHEISLINNDMLTDALSAYFFTLISAFGSRAKSVEVAPGVVVTVDMVEGDDGDLFASDLETAGDGPWTISRAALGTILGQIAKLLGHVDIPIRVNRTVIGAVLAKIFEHINTLKTGSIQVERIEDTEIYSRTPNKE